MAYAELYCLSNFSFLTGASHPEELVLTAEQLGYQAIAITDECSVAGVVRAHHIIKTKNLAIKLIVGASFCFEETLNFVLIAPDRAGYAELCRVITNARRRCQKGQYQLSWWDLQSIKHCFIIWLPSGENGCDTKYGQLLTKYHSQRLWLGYCRFLQSDEQQYHHHCEQLAKQYNTAIVACGGVQMHDAQRQPLQDVLTAIKCGKPLTQMGCRLNQNAERSLRSFEKLNKLYPQQHLNNTILLAEQCTFSLSSLRYEYPSELVPEEKTAIEYLRDLVTQGIKLRFVEEVPENIKATIEKELFLIEEQGYEYFFLTIYDVVQFAKKQNILYQGRGSAANSIVCYCLEITSVDPRQISVLFERFISKERDEPPDIDVDFEHHRREEVFQYIYQKYGRERSAIAATVVTYRFKSALRDVGKVFGINDTQIDFFIKNTNRRDKTQHWSCQLQELGLKTESIQGQYFIRLVNEILGFPRHLSQHVGGFVISSGPLYELVPIENAAMPDRTVIQWDKDDLESLGLLKVDVLALGMLTAIRHSFDYIKQHYQQSLSIAKITALPEDPQVYAMLQQADTVGVFQIESRAQMSMLPRLKPKSYYDLVIQIAIVRPGPIQGDMVHPYLRRRNGDEAVTYPSEAVKEVLKRTLGVPIFQEQVIKLAMVAAGFTGGEADQLRRAMAKWQRNGKLEQFKDKLITGMKSRGYEESFAERIFQQICGFGEYGFPESHSASFAVLAYVSAWLKYYFPAAFYTGLLNSYPMGFYSPSQLVQDAQRHQVVIKSVDINLSQAKHHMVFDKSTNHYQIQLGLNLIKGLSKNAIETLSANRPFTGFNTIEDLLALPLSKSDLQALASSDALKAIVGNRYQARWQIVNNALTMELWQNNKEQKVNEVCDISQQYSFEYQPTDIDELIEDYSAIGLSIDKHPIKLLKQNKDLAKLLCASDLKAIKHNTVVSVIGLVTGKQSPGTASGVTFFTLEDHTGNINVVVWQATAQAQKKQYLTAKILKVTGILEREGEVIHIIAGQLVDLTPLLHELELSSRDFH